MWTLWWTSCSGPLDQEMQAPLCKFDMAHTLQLPSSSSYWVTPLLSKLNVPNRWFLLWKGCISMPSISNYALYINQRLLISSRGVPQWSARKWLCHQSKWGSISGSVPCSNFALTTETWLAHCTVQKACSCTQRSLNCQQWTWCTALTTHPSWFARIQISGPCKKNDQHLPNSPVFPGSSAIGRSLFLSGHWDGKNLYRSIDLHPSFEPTPLHYTMHSGWERLHLNPTFLTDVYGLLPPTGGESA